jgi:mannosyl-oligosaccharide alpha-1,3-glucosidase
MWRDPLTLVVALDSTGQAASGQLYLDDGDTFAYERGEFVWRGFEVSPAHSGGLQLRSFDRFSRDELPARLAKHLTKYDAASNRWAKKIADVRVENVVIRGLPGKPSCVRLNAQSLGLEFEWRDGVSSTTAARKRGGPAKKASELIVRGVAAQVVTDWTLLFEFGSTACQVNQAEDTMAKLQSPECQSGHFLCRNPGHIPSCILTTRVNDGLCEPECCDGSDEFDSKRSCPNVCKQANAEYQKRAEEEERVSRAGSSVRREYIAFGEKEKARMEANVDRIGKELVGIEDKAKRLKELLERTESRKAGEIERKKASTLYRTLVKHQSAIRSLRSERAMLDESLEHLSQILADLKAGFNPNYQVRHATVCELVMLANCRYESGHGRPRGRAWLRGLAETWRGSCRR